MQYQHKFHFRLYGSNVIQLIQKKDELHFPHFSLYVF